MATIGTQPSKKSIKKMEKERELRNKGWEELLIDEKIERMRGIIKQDTQSINNRLNSLTGITSKLKNHTHKENGDIVVPLEEKGYGLGKCTGVAKSEKVWF